MAKATSIDPTTALLYRLLQPVMTAAWRGKGSPVKRSNAHEPNHVARFVHAAPHGIATAIKGLPGVSGAKVQGVFCHRKPYAFWADANDPTGFSKRELADLMVEVKIASPRGRASRALLIQVKMGDLPTWGAPLTLAALDAGQRRLYADLPSFCLEFGYPLEIKRADLVRQGLQAIPPGMSPYKLAPRLLPLRARGLVYAAVDRKHLTRVQAPTPWLVEEGRPSGAHFATFDVDFAFALAEMVVAQNTRFGLRSDRKALIRDWANLIHEVKMFASWRSLQPIWKGRRACDVVLRTRPSTTVLDNIAAFLTSDGALQHMWTCAGTRLRRDGDPFGAAVHDLWSYAPWDFDTTRVHSDNGPEDGPPAWPDAVESEPEGGFGFLSIRIQVDERQG